MPDGSDTAALDLGERPTMPDRTVWGVVGAGVVAAAIVPGTRTGLSLFVVAVAVAVAVVVAVRRHMSTHEIAFGSLGLVLASMTMFRMADWVLAVDVLAVMGLACFAMTSATTWRALAGAPLVALAMVPWVPPNVLRPVVTRVRRRGPDGLRTFVRTSSATIVLVVVFGVLFMSADAAFARLANEVLLPDLELYGATARVLTFAIVTLFTGALVLVKPALATSRFAQFRAWEMPRSDSRARPERKVLEWALPIAALDVVFALFVAVQMTVLFGGRHHVELTPGLTYAEYARQGFFQLLAVAALVLVVVAVTIGVARPRSETERRVARLVLGALCVLTLVVLSSAWYRLGVYEEMYGLTRLRISVYWSIAWLAAIFILLIGSGIVWKAAWVPRATVAVTAVGLLAFTLIDPDALIAQRNVQRYEENGAIDLGYLASLSEDAVPALVSLPDDLRDCVLSQIAWNRGTRDDRGWPEFNLSRSRARGIITDLGVPLDPNAACANVSSSGY